VDNAHEDKIFCLGAFFLCKCFAKVEKICYNRGMERKQTSKNGVLTSLIGAPTPAKASGLTYSLAATLSIVVAFLFMIVIGMLGLTEEGYDETDWYLYCAYLLTPLTFGLVAWLVLRWSGQSVGAEIRAQACPARYFVIAILLQCGLLCLSQLNDLFLNWLRKFGYEDTPINIPSLDGFGFVGALLVIAVLPAIFEEIIFRGIVFSVLADRFSKNKKGFLKTYVISSVIFGLAHLFNGFSFGTVLQVGYTVLTGGLFAFCLIMTKNILCCALVHGIYNFCGLLFDHVQGLGNGVVFDLGTVITMAVISVVVGIFVLYKVYHYPDEERKDLYARLGIAKE
jgi:membrane protease YdiL (CAAX protease family)